MVLSFLFLQIVHDAEETIQGICQFKKDGTCPQTSIVTDKDRKEYKMVIYVKFIDTVLFRVRKNTCYFGEHLLSVNNSL